MAFSEVAFNETERATIRTIGRVSQLLLDLRNEYERRPTETVVAQIRQRIRELHELEQQLGEADVAAAG